MNALAREHQKSLKIASLAVVADGKEKADLALYWRFGFTLLGSYANRFFLPMGSIAKLNGKNG